MENKKDIIIQEGRIVQLIPGEKASSYGFKKMEDYDYVYVQRERKNDFFLLLTLLSCISMLLIPVLLGGILGMRLTGILFLFLVIIFLLLVNKQMKREELKPVNYIDTAIPVKRPHDFKLKDKVRFIISLEKE